MGGVIEVKPNVLMEMLVGTVLVHNVSEMIFAIADSLFDAKREVRFSKIASSMRASHRKNHSVTDGDYPCDYYTVPPYLAAMLDKMVSTLFCAIKQLYIDNGIDEISTHKIVASLLVLHLTKHQVESREYIEKTANQHATKGGVLEKGMVIFGRILERKIKAAFYQYPNMKLDENFTKCLFDSIYLANEIVTEHGRRLDTKKVTKPYEVENHAILFALLAKSTVNSGIDGAKEALSIGVIKYARERGDRMRQRCERYGDAINMLSYKVYCEWQPENTEMSIITLQKSPVNKTEVTQRHWVNDWEKFGLSEYGKYYCDYADHNLVKGFSDDMNVEMPKIYSRGADCCSFIWHGADLTEENEAWIAKRRDELRDKITFYWEYHTAHLYHTIVGVLKSSLGKGAQMIIDNFRLEYAKTFTKESLCVLDEYEGHDFTVAL